jgi:hypothetical protein
MRRVLEFCEWKAAWWGEQVNAHEDISPHLSEGLQAYAVQQADMEQCIRLAWGTKWAAAQQLAQPIIQVAMGVAFTVPMAEPGQSLVIDLDIDEDDDGGGGIGFRGIDIFKILLLFLLPISLLPPLSLFLI